MAICCWCVLFACCGAVYLELLPMMLMRMWISLLLSCPKPYMVDHLKLWIEKKVWSTSPALLEPGSEGNSAECTKATTNDTDSISTDPLLPSHESSDPNPQTGLQPPAPPTGAGQSHQTNPVQGTGVTGQIRQDVEEVKTKKDLKKRINSKTKKVTKNNCRVKTLQ
ncbi:mucin-associated surface protein (MASP) [Trypanosoma cruzi]|nr:mucin-associated surface protein (MASP) [Trypanosoma cruzi]